MRFDTSSQLVALLSRPQSSVSGTQLIWDPDFEERFMRLASSICVEGRECDVAQAFWAIHCCHVLCDVETNSYSDLFIESGRLKGDEVVKPNVILFAALLEESQLDLAILIHLLKRTHASAIDKLRKPLLELYIKRLCSGSYFASKDGTNKESVSGYCEVVELFLRNGHLNQCSKSQIKGILNDLVKASSKWRQLELDTANENNLKMHVRKLSAVNRSVAKNDTRATMKEFTNYHGSFNSAQLDRYAKFTAMFINIHQLVEAEAEVYRSTSNDSMPYQCFLVFLLFVTLFTYLHFVTNQIRQTEPPTAATFFNLW